MAAELKDTIPEADVELLPEGKGIFDIKVSAELIYSKYATGRFPKSGEISQLITDLKI